MDPAGSTGGMGSRYRPGPVMLRVTYNRVVLAGVACGILTGACLLLVRRGVIPVATLTGLGRPAYAGRGGNVPSVSVTSDGKIEIRALWTVVVNENYAVVASPDGDRFRPVPGTRGLISILYFVLVTNVSGSDITVPSYVIGGAPRGPLPVGKRFEIVYGIIPDTFMHLSGAAEILVSQYAYRPVILHPGETTELPVYTKVARDTKGADLEVVYDVDQRLAARYGWWSGRLECLATEFQPGRNGVPE